VQAITILTPLAGEGGGEFVLPDGVKQLGDYYLLSKLGRGGMGTVYRAVQTRLGKTVVVKLLPPERLGSPRALSRFRREVEAVGGLEHPNIVRALDAREENGVQFLVMEYLDGIDLGKLIWQRGPLPVADACEAVRQAALGLDYAHSRCGLVHRDIKPSNLLLTPGGVVKVLDLGLARWHRRRPEGPPPEPHDSTGDGIVGTADYMAPEQWLDSHAVDTPADVYGLGCTLFHLLTGRPPFAGIGYETQGRKMMAHAQKPVPPIRSVRPDVPEGLALFLVQMLAKRWEERLSTPGEVAAALRPFALGHDLPALLRTLPQEETPGDDKPIPAGATPIVTFGSSKHEDWLWTRKAGGPSMLALAVAACGVAAALFALGLAIWWGSSSRDFAQFEDPGNEGFVSLAGDVQDDRPAGADADRIRAFLLDSLRVEAGEMKPLGELGRGPVLINDQVVTRARFASPVYAYLLFINPDGSPHLLHPEAEPAAPTSEMEEYLTLDSEGFVSLALVATGQPLEKWDEWKPTVDAVAWKQVQSDRAWLFQGQGFAPVSREPLAFGERAPQPFADLCHLLKGRPGVVGVRAMAFAVQAKSQKRPAPEQKGLKPANSLEAPLPRTSGP
jgi:serine/threonine protein kinase